MLLTVDLERLELRRGERLLDAGCGEGRHCFGALERGAHVVGLDLDLRPRAQAAGALALPRHGAGLPARCSQGNTFHLPFPDASFDKVICSEVMEHVHDYRAAARELARVTRPGGRVAVTIPTATSEHLYLRVGDDYFESPGGHIRIFRPRELARGLAAAGLATTGVGFAHALHTPYWVLRSIAGLPRADESALVRAYRAVPDPRDGVARDRAPRARAQLLLPKSVILYAEKPARRGARERGRVSARRAAAHRLRRLPRQHALRRPGRVPLVPGARARAPRPPRRRAGWARPTPIRCPSREVHRLPNEQFWAGWFNKDRAKMLPRPLRRVFEPLNFYELGASRMGFLPEPFAFSVRALRALTARLRRGERYDLVHDVQCLGWGLLPLRALGLPVVTTVHHPLSVDRRASFDRDRNLREALGTMEFYPVGMQAAVARRAGLRVHVVARRARARSSATSAWRRGGSAWWRTASTPSCSGRIRRRRAIRTRSCASAAPRDPNKGVRTLIEALAQRARARAAHPGGRRPPRQPGARLGRARRRRGPRRDRRARGRRRRWSRSTAAPRSWWCRRATRASACRRPRRWRAARRWSRARRARCPR